MGRGEGLKENGKVAASTPSRSGQAAKTASKPTEQEQVRYANVDSDIWELAEEPGNEDELEIDGEIWLRLYDNPTGVRAMVLGQTDGSQEKLVERVLEVSEDQPFGTTSGKITPISEFFDDHIRQLDYKYDDGREKTTLIWEQNAELDEGESVRDDDERCEITLSRVPEKLRWLPAHALASLCLDGEEVVSALDEHGYQAS